MLESIQIPSHESSEIILYNKVLVEKMIKLGKDIVDIRQSEFHFLV